jgi:hypothetical protein
MKNTKWVGLVTVLAFPLLSGYGQAPEAAAPGAPGQAQAAAPVNLSPGAAEVVRLAGSGVGDDVVVAYIQNSQAPFNLSADAVLYLKDVGLSPQVTSAMLSHDGTLRGQPQQSAPAAPVPAAAPGNAPLTYNWQPSAAPGAPAPAAPSAPVAAPPPAYVTTAPPDVSFFYSDLSPYGTWVSLEGIGWCWQPRTVVVTHGWRPYCDGGHWVYTDAGWFWQSDYSWGWAPFHYGRWYQHPRCGWVWTPDRVWGPAWVTWRTAGDCCGWAPLPPRAEFDLRLGWRFNGVSVRADFDFGLGVRAFAFVSFGDFCNHDLGHHCLPPARVTTIYRQTTVVNNYVVVNNTIVHRGIPLERVTAASRVPVPRATIRDLPAGSARIPIRGGAVVYRPQLRAPARPVNMVAQKVDAGHPVIQHAPIAPVSTGRPSAFSRSGSAPVAAPNRPAAPAPRTSSWSGSAKPASSPPVQSTAKTYQPAPTLPSAPATLRAPVEWKQGASSGPGYRSDAGLPALNNARTAGQTPPVTPQMLSLSRNPHVYYPKSARQAAEIHSLPSSDQRPSESPASTGKSSDSKSGNKQ